MQLTLAKLCAEMPEALLVNAEHTAAQRQWYAAYTLPRHEKKVSEYLPCKHVETFCPVYEASRNWNGRHASINQPLFPGYVFVRIAFADRVKVLECPSVLRFVCCAGRPVAIPDEEMQALQAALAQRQALPHPFLAPGRRVRVCSGALSGLEGTVVRQKGKTRFVVALKWIERSVAFEVQSADLNAI